MPVISAVGTETIGCSWGGFGAMGAKKGSLGGLPSSVQLRRSGRGAPARCTLDLAGVQAAGADLDLDDLPVLLDACDLEVGAPDAARLGVGVRDVVPVGRALVAHVAAAAIDGHGLLPRESDELDARHLRAVTLAVAGLEDARVATGPGGELRPDLLEQLVRGGALLHVAAGEAARVQGARAGLRDQLLDEGAKLLRLGLRGLDRAVLDER